jgi:hypothetical protein
MHLFGVHQLYLRTSDMSLDIVLWWLFVNKGRVTSSWCWPISGAILQVFNQNKMTEWPCICLATILFKNPV